MLLAPFIDTFGTLTSQINSVEINPACYNNDLAVVEQMLSIINNCSSAACTLVNQQDQSAAINARDYKNICDIMIEVSNMKFQHLYRMNQTILHDGFFDYQPLYEQSPSASFRKIIFVPSDLSFYGDDESSFG